MLPFRRLSVLNCTQSAAFTTPRSPLRVANISYLRPVQQLNTRPVQLQDTYVLRRPPLRIRTFSHFSPRNIRRTYFPSGRPDTWSRNSGFGGFFNSTKRRFNSLPPSVIIWTILGLNGVVYILWNVGFNAARGGDPTLLVSLNKNFTLSWTNWKEGRIWSVLTSCFSHEGHRHIFMNALTFYFMAPPVLQILGNASFLALYIGGGVASSLITLFTNEMVFRNHHSVHGANSGAIYAVISFMACVAPRASFLIFGIIPVPAWGCVGGLFAYDLYNAVNEHQTGTSEVSHIAGILAGIAYFLRLTGRLPRF
ncbi:rhomboid-domain-containing protein [Hysterangium stoloniferum]|nr:rhomboid-domain-containing protein [Hysterangium stoloniferum]